MRVFLRTGLLCAVTGLLLPAGALAADVTVPPGGSINETIANANEGDRVLIPAGTYAENVTVGKRVTLVGLDGAKIVGTGAADADAVTVSVAGVRIETVAIESSRGSAVATTDAGGVTLEKLIVQRTGGAAGTAAVDGAGAGGVKLVNAIAANAAGPVVLLTSSTANTIAGSTLAATATTDDADAVRLVSGSAEERRLGVDSSLLIGGPAAAGMRVETLDGSGPAALVLRHVTIHGPTDEAGGLELDASDSGLLSVAGDITAEIDGSIVHGKSTAANHVAPLGLGPSSKVTAAFRNSEGPAVAESTTDDSGPNVTYAAHTVHTDDKLFGRAFHLRADAPVINAGGPVAADEHQTDVDGQPRNSGGADKGADEFHNSPPKAALTVSNPNPIQNEAVTFTSTSTDPDVGDAPQGYAWSFGDGTAPVTTVTPSVSHAYPNVGTYTVKLAVVDRFGAASQVAEATVTVRDGTPPEIKIVTPKSGAKLRLNPKKKKGAKRRPRPRPLTAIGTMRDLTGVASVELALTFKGKRGKRCRQYTGRALRRAACDRYTWVKARLIGDSWSYTTRRGLRLRPGRYDLRARGTDVNGVTSTAFTGSSGTLVRFRVR